MTRRTIFCGHLPGWLGTLLISGAFLMIWVPRVAALSASDRLAACEQIRVVLGSELVTCNLSAATEITAPERIETVAVLSDVGIDSQHFFGSIASPQTALQTAPQTAAVALLQLVQDPKIDHNVYFKLGSSELKSQSQLKLGQLVVVLRSPVMAGTCLKLVGHTDASGNAEANRRISLARAEIARAFLVRQLGSWDVQIDVEGRGEMDLLPGVSRDSAKNRRVEIWARACQILG